MIKKRITLLIWIWFLTYLTGTILVSVGLTIFSPFSSPSSKLINLIYFQISYSLILFSFIIASIPFVVFIIKIKYDLNKKFNVFKVSIFSSLLIFVSFLLSLNNSKLNLTLIFNLGIPFVISNFSWFYIFKNHLKSNVQN